MFGNGRRRMSGFGRVVAVFAAAYFLSGTVRLVEAYRALGGGWRVLAAGYMACVAGGTAGALAGLAGRAWMFRMTTLPALAVCVFGFSYGETVVQFPGVFHYWAHVAYRFESGERLKVAADLLAVGLLAATAWVTRKRELTAGDIAKAAVETERIRKAIARERRTR